jgi:predicted secreted protein
MTITFMLASYFVIWWTVLFAVLPFGVRTQGEAGSVVPGTPASAPAQFRLGRVALMTTVVATIVFAVLWAGIRLRIIDLETLVSRL